MLDWPYPPRQSALGKSAGPCKSKVLHWVLAIVTGSVRIRRHITCTWPSTKIKVHKIRIHSEVRTSKLEFCLHLSVLLSVLSWTKCHAAPGRQTGLGLARGRNCNQLRLTLSRNWPLVATPLDWDRTLLLIMIPRSR